MSVGHCGVPRPEYDMAQVSYAGNGLVGENTFFYGRRVGHRDLRRVFQSEVFHGLEFSTSYLTVLIVIYLSGAII